jgi:23S rRNA pseudouridine1911/1915/1917 synthase
VHRLDKDTTGVIVFAKTSVALDSIMEQFRTRNAKKTYTALAYGVIETRSGSIYAPIGRDKKHRTRMAVVRIGGRDARTDWTAASCDEKQLTQFTLYPQTGRTHQIRVHLAYIGHPILGDTLYGFKRQPAYVQRTLLHASTLEIMHPLNREKLIIHAPLPDDMLLYQKAPMTHSECEPIRH